MYMYTTHIHKTHCVQGIGERLVRTEEECNVGWLSVDQCPVKDTLTALLSKWKAAYTGYLERQVRHIPREKEGMGIHTCIMVPVVIHTYMYIRTYSVCVLQ